MLGREKCRDCARPEAVPEEEDVEGGGKGCGQCITKQGRRILSHEE